MKPADDEQREPWVPPPALTTPAMTCVGVAKRGLVRGIRQRRRRQPHSAPERTTTDRRSAAPLIGGSKKSFGCCRSSSHSRIVAGDASQRDDHQMSLFQSRLQHLLSDIRHLKSELIDGPASDETYRNGFSSTKLQQQSDEIERRKMGQAGELASTVAVTSEGRATTDSRGAAMAQRGKKSNSRSHVVSDGRRQDSLLAKLSRIEGNAHQVILHVESLRNTVDKFIEGSTEYTEADRMQHADGDKPPPGNVLNNARDDRLPLDNRNMNAGDRPHTTDSEVMQITQQVQSLQCRISEDRKLIDELQTVLRNMKSTSLAEKEESKKNIKLHKDRADRYLASIESLNVRTSQKNKEMAVLKQEVGSLRLDVSRLECEKERLTIENNTLASKLNAADLGRVGLESMTTSQLEAMSSKFLEASSKIASSEKEQEQLKRCISKLKNEIADQNLKIQELQTNRLEKSVEHGTPASHTPVKKVNKSIQVDMPIVGQTEKSSSQIANNVEVASGKESEQWLRMFEMWQQLQNDKINILQSLKDLEKKLETSQRANVAFRTEITTKEGTLQEIGARLIEKIEENKSLQKLLEDALSDTRRYGDLAKEKTLSLDTVTQSRIRELEKALLECQKANGNLKKENNDVEQKMNGRIQELEQRLELADKSKRAMNDYITFLKTSYANVFGDGFIAK